LNNKAFSIQRVHQPGGVSVAINDCSNKKGQSSNLACLYRIFRKPEVNHRQEKFKDASSTHYRSLQIPKKARQMLLQKDSRGL
jgi:hypothetical protein